MHEQPPTPIADVITIGVPVTDQDRALEFYLDRFGFETRRDVAIQQFGGRRIEAAPAGAAITIALVPSRDGVPTGVETGIRLATADAAAVHAQQASGVDVRSERA
jgi:predicted enzyme related to lactoylglutathione lyase